MTLRRAIVVVALAMLTPACWWFDRCSSDYEGSWQDAVLAVAPDDLDCKKDDLHYGFASPGSPSTVANVAGCGKTAIYDCSHDDCGYVCHLRGKVVRP